MGEIVEINEVKENCCDIDSTFTAYSLVEDETLGDILSTMLNTYIPVTSNSIVYVTGGEVLYVAKYNGPKIKEGSKVLPNGGYFEFYKIRNVN